MSKKKPTKVSAVTNSFAKSGKKAIFKATGVVSEVSKLTTESSHRAWEKTSEVVVRAADSAAKEGKKVLTQVRVSVTKVAKRGKSIFNDDVERIKAECPLLNQWTSPGLPHSVLNSTILTAAAMGLLKNERDLLRMTRKMDSNRAIFQKVLKLFCKESEIKKISQWMDKIPYRRCIGGGVTHRVKHGHDIGALIKLIKRHNFKGAAVWFNHVGLQDFWTPAGVPYLPIGNKTIYGWLQKLGLGKKTAANLLSVYCTRLAFVLTIYCGGKDLYQFVKKKIKKRKIKNLWNRAIELEHLGDYGTASYCYDKILTSLPEDSEFTLWTAMKYFQYAQQQDHVEMWKSNLLRAYQLADTVRIKLIKDKVIPYHGGILLSMRGLAAIIMASSWMGMSAHDDYHVIKGIIASGVNDLVKMAERLKQRIGLRLFSSVANEALVLDLLIDAPFDLPTVYTPLTIHGRITETLTGLSKKKNKDGKYAEKVLGGFIQRYPGHI